MSGGWGPVVGTIVAAFFGLLGAYLVYRNGLRANKTNDTQGLIDQLQEERKTDHEKYNDALDRLEKRQARSEQRLEAAESMFRLASDYILTLRYHIAEGQPPPPPPFPPELTRGLGGDH